MAMNKAERAEMERLQAAVTPLFPSYEQPKPLTAEEIDALPTVEVKSKYGGMTKVSPVWFANVYSAEQGEASRAITHGAVNGHGVNRAQVADTDSRREGNSSSMFATKDGALKYLRFEVAKRFAAKLKKLKNLDDAIAEVAK